MMKNNIRWLKIIMYHPVTLVEHVPKCKRDLFNDPPCLMLRQELILSQIL